MSEDAPLAMTPGEMAEAIGELTGSIAEISELLTEISQELDGEPAGGPWLWHLLPSEAAAALARELGEWVSWLHERYIRNTPATDYWLPACWFRHPVAVDELTALMVAHQSVYSRRARKKTAELAYWHEIHLWPCLRRLNTELRIFDQCIKNKGRHVEDESRRAHPHDNAEDLAAWAQSFVPVAEVEHS